MNKKLVSRLAFAAIVAATFSVTSPVRASDTDDRIESSFKKSYVYTTYLKDESVNTSVKEGVVTLTGSVSTESHKSLAQDTASSLPGVIRVDNQLETKADIAAENADSWIVRKSKLALMFHRNVDAGNTTITSKDGVVTLTGSASSVAQKDLTTEYTKDIEGVVEVRNDMVVSSSPVMAERTPGEKMDDASVTSQVRNALLTHRSTSAIATKVTTRDGEVTLTGIAKNDAEKALVSKLVNDIHGVSSVKNEMTVEAPKTI